jgi:hypothetical protein
VGLLVDAREDVDRLAVAVGVVLGEPFVEQRRGIAAAGSVDGGGRALAGARDRRGR